jgi:hypothetical protein
MHPQGHVIPMLTTNMALIISEHAEATTRRQTVVGRVDQHVKMRSHQQHTGSLAFGEPRLGDRLGGRGADGDFDSMALLHAGGGSRSPQLNLLFNMYGVAIVMVVYAHWGRDVFRAVELKFGNTSPSKLLDHFGLFEHLRGLTSSIFPVLAGVADSVRGVSTTQLKRDLCTSAVALYVMHYSNLPEMADAIYHATSQWHRGCTHCSIVGRLTAPAWWFLSISSFRALLYVATARQGDTRKVLPGLALLAHFGSFGMLLPYPLRRNPLHRLYVKSAVPLATLLPVRQPPFALATMWWLYATVPLFLPRGFPLNLPLADQIGTCWSRLAEQIPSTNTTLSTPTVVRLFWVVLALVAARISAILGLEGYSTLPYVCANLPQDDTTPCINAVRTFSSPILSSPLLFFSFPLGAWSLRAALADCLSCVIGVVGIIGLAAATPRMSLPMLTRVGQHSLLVLITHIYVCPFLTVAAGKCVQYGLRAAGLGEIRDSMTGLVAFEIEPVLVIVCLSVSWLLVNGVQAVNFGVRTLTKWWAQRDWWGPPHRVTRGLNRPVTIDGEVGQDKRPVRVQHAKRLLLALALAVVLACFRLRRADVCSLNSPQRPYRSCSGWKLKPPGWGWKLMGTNRTIKLSLQLHKRHRQAHRQASGNKRPHQPKPDKVR